MSDIRSCIGVPQRSYLDAPQFKEYLKSVHRVLQGEFIPDIVSLGESCMDLFLEENPTLCMNLIDVDVAVYVSARNRMNNGEHIAQVYEEMYGVKDERKLGRMEFFFAERTNTVLESLSKPSLTAKVLSGPWLNTTPSQKTT